MNMDTYWRLQCALPKRQFTVQRVAQPTTFFLNESAQLSDEKRETSCTSSISFVSVELGRHTYLERNCLNDHQRLALKIIWAVFKSESPVWNFFHGRDQLNTNKVSWNARPLYSQLSPCELPANTDSCWIPGENYRHLTATNSILDPSAYGFGNASVSSRKLLVNSAPE